MGRCLYCQEKAGFLKKTCHDCTKLTQVFDRLKKEGSFGYSTLLDVLLETGVPTDKIDHFLETDLDGSGSLRDKVTARMTNEVMSSLGIPTDMDAEKVKAVRAVTSGKGEKKSVK